MTGEGRGRGKFQWTAAGCGGYLRQPRREPEVCKQPPTWVGIIYQDHPRPSVSRGFACDEHRDHLDVARPITEHDESELRRRRGGERPVPMAVGREAKEVIAAARRWAAGQDRTR